MPTSKRKDPVGEEEILLCSLYDKQPRTLDDLPYTEEFDLLYGDFTRINWNYSRHEVWKFLKVLGKDQKLPYKVKKKKVDELRKGIKGFFDVS